MDSPAKEDQDLNEIVEVETNRWEIVPNPDASHPCSQFPRFWLTVRKIEDKTWQGGDDSWIIGYSIIITWHASKPEGTCWPGPYRRVDGFFTVSEAQRPLPKSRLVRWGADEQWDDCPISPYLDCQHWGSVLWVGLAYLEVISDLEPQSTKHHVTLEELKKRSWTFATPRVLYHGFHDGRDYTIIERLPGWNLNFMWRKKDKAWQDRLVKQLAAFHLELSKWRGESICGVDGRDLPSGALRAYRKSGHPSSPQALLKNCRQIGMDCSEIVFCHAGLQPDDIFADDEGLVGVQFWETAGFTPKDWVLTSASYFPWCHNDIYLQWSFGETVAFADGLRAELEKAGFNDLSEGYQSWCERARIAGEKEIVEENGHTAGGAGRRLIWSTPNSRSGRIRLPEFLDNLTRLENRTMIEIRKIIGAFRTIPIEILRMFGPPENPISLRRKGTESKEELVDVESSNP